MQLHRIKADACLLLGNEAVLTEPATNYDRAITEYRVAMAAQVRQPNAAIDKPRLRTGRSEALSRQHDSSGSEQEAARFTRELLRDATIPEKAPPVQTAVGYYRGDALLPQALSERPPARCETRRREAVALAHASRLITIKVPAKDLNVCAVYHS